MSNNTTALDIVLEEDYEYCIGAAFILIAESKKAVDNLELKDALIEAREFIKREIVRRDATDWYTIDEYATPSTGANKVVKWISDLDLNSDLKIILGLLNTTTWTCGKPLQSTLLKVVNSLALQIEVIPAFTIKSHQAPYIYNN